MHIFSMYFSKFKYTKHFNTNPRFAALKGVKFCYFALLLSLFKVIKIDKYVNILFQHIFIFCIIIISIIIISISTIMSLYFVGFIYSGLEHSHSFFATQWHGFAIFCVADFLENKIQNSLVNMWSIKRHLINVSSEEYYPKYLEWILKY